jgi:hypothetical protein
MKKFGNGLLEREFSRELGRWKEEQTITTP